MRNFEERLAEISRRSEAILLQRKKRKKQILTVCIPLVLCTAIAIPLILPKPKAETPGSVESAVLKEDVSNHANGNMSNSTSVTTPFTAIEITNLSHSQTLTDQAQIARIIGYIHNVIEFYVNDPTEPDTQENPPGGIADDNVYRIHAYKNDAIIESYSLSDAYVLVDNKTGKEYRLTTDEAESLTTLLSDALILVDNKTGDVFELG